MNPFEFVLVIILAGMGYNMWRMKHYADRGLSPDKHTRIVSAEKTPREAELQREVEDLRERLHVLERIATEDRETRRLSAEIESLRSPSAPGEER